MKKNRTKFIALIGVIFCILSIAICSVFFYVVSQEKKSFNESSIERQKTRIRVESLEILTRTFEDTKNERETLTAQMLKEEDIVNFLALIESLGKEQGAGLTTNSLTVKPLDKVYETLVVNITVKGTYSSVMNVLKLFEKLPYQTTIGSVKLEKNGDSLWTSVYDVRVTKFKKI